MKRFLFSPQELVLIAVTIFWGGSYAIMHVALASCGPVFFVAMRFLLAGLLTCVFFPKILRTLSRADLVAGLVIGVPVCLGQTLQTIGLQTITVSQSAFLTALYVPVVPLLQWIVMKKRPHLMAWLGLGCAFAGVLLLTCHGAKGLTFSVGDVLTLCSAVAIAAEIVLIGRFAEGDLKTSDVNTPNVSTPSVNAVNVTAIQLLTAGFLALGALPFTGDSLPSASWGWIVPTLGLAAASVAVQLAMNWAQKTISPTKATIIYAGDPVWGGVFGRLMGETLPASALLGAAFIVAGVIVSDLRPSWVKK